MGGSAQLDVVGQGGAPHHGLPLAMDPPKAPQGTPNRVVWGSHLCPKGTILDAFMGGMGELGGVVWKWVGYGWMMLDGQRAAMKFEHWRELDAVRSTAIGTWYANIRKGAQVGSICGVRGIGRGSQIGRGRGRARGSSGWSASADSC